jgi:thiamine pyrophosphokinase
MNRDLQPVLQHFHVCFPCGSGLTCSNPAFLLLWMLFVNRPCPFILFSVAMIGGRQDHLVTSKTLLPSFSLKIKPFQAISEND